VTEMGAPVRFTLHQGGFPSEIFSTRSTVGNALNALGADYSRQDLVGPPPETPLTAGLHVFVERATVITLSVAGDDPARVYTHADTVGGLLAERGVEISEDDSVAPALSTPLSNGLAVSVTVVREITEFEDTPIPFTTIYRDDASLAQGEHGLVQEGEDGFMRRQYSVVYENGEEVSRDLLSEVVVAPTHRIVAQGTAVVPAAVAAPVAAPAAAPDGEPQCARTLTVWATWYTAASAGGSGTTATGTTVRKGTVAVDPSVIPLGTRMYIPGYGYGVAEDTGGAVIGNIIDLGYGPNDVMDWRSGWVEICILSAGG
jgi:3D (Asp-Asp-Asp) domain-containing protein